jgi:tagatose-6-phosphate ketose/aldose isomerase
MNLLGRSQESLEANGGIHTAREIAQQPAVWNTIAHNGEGDAAGLRAFLAPLLARQDLRIILTGAGTSAFIGQCLAPALKQRAQRRVDAVASTDLVGSPDTWLERDVPSLLVHFARSGNSPESVAALLVAEHGLQERHHLIVTCNADGALCREARRLGNAHVVVLPPETNDRGFAMTSSFTGMLLAVALAFGVATPDLAASLGKWSEELLETSLPLIESLTKSKFERVVYLGGKAFAGLAREAALKLLELTDGKIVALNETPLGFRHGPKTIVNDKTLIVMFLGNDPYARQYDEDLLRELHTDAIAARILALRTGEGAGHRDDLMLKGAERASDLALCFPYAVFAQSFAFLQSLELGVRPDTPNARGIVHRVVQGVSIYPWNPSR